MKFRLTFSYVKQLLFSSSYKTVPSFLFILNAKLSCCVKDKNITWLINMFLLIKLHGIFNRYSKTYFIISFKFCLLYVLQLQNAKIRHFLQTLRVPFSFTFNVTFISNSIVISLFSQTLKIKVTTVFYLLRGYKLILRLHLYICG